MLFMINIDEEVSKKIGTLISRIDIKRSQDTPKDDNLEYERLLWIIHTVIAHQMNSFFLEKALRKIPKENFNSHYLEKIGVDEVRKLLKGYHKPERILSEERTKMINDFCKVLNNNFDGEISVLLGKSNFKVVDFRRNLDHFKAFSEDPLRKKSNILIQLLSRFNLVDFKDPKNINPAIDYHLIRLSLRNGRIKIKDKELKSKIIQQKPITKKEDKLIREKVIEAFRITQKASSRTIPELNWIEWHIARSICIRDEPLCNLDENNVSEFLDFESEKKCPLFEFCEKNKEYLREPFFETSFY